MTEFRLTAADRRRLAAQARQMEAAEKKIAARKIAKYKKALRDAARLEREAIRASKDYAAAVKRRKRITR